jgi:nucleoside-diphosphate-sugar epimerase
MNTLILGSNGFIGKRLCNEMSVNHKITEVDRNTDLAELESMNYYFDYIINCASSKAAANNADSQSSNYDFPLRILKNFAFGNWIQIESNFQLQIPMGRNDPYTLDKNLFSKYLDAHFTSLTTTRLSHLYMPHVFGDGDRPGRLINSAIKSFISNIEFDTSSGEQYLPILHVDDAISGILQLIENPQGISSCTPFWYGKVKDLLKLISSALHSGQINFCVIPEPIDANFQKVKFPPCVPSWNPKMQINDFLEWVRQHKDVSSTDTRKF